MPRISSPDGFTREAVRLDAEGGHSRKQVARDPGVSAGSLRGWIYRYAQAGPLVSDKLPEAEQIRELRRELQRVQTERDILENAVGTTTVGGGFSQMPPQT